jgi:hypothetical protein
LITNDTYRFKLSGTCDNKTNHILGTRKGDTVHVKTQNKKTVKILICTFKINLVQPAAQRIVKISVLTTVYKICC